MGPKKDKGKQKLIDEFIPPKESPKRVASGQPRETSPVKKRSPSPAKAGHSDPKNEDTEKGKQDSKKQSILDAIEILINNEGAKTRNEFKECLMPLVVKIEQLSESVEDIKNELKSRKKDE
jgi:hypothetical protein